MKLLCTMFSLLYTNIKILSYYVYYNLECLDVLLTDRSSIDCPTGLDGLPLSIRDFICLIVYYIGCQYINKFPFKKLVFKERVIFFL